MAKFPITYTQRTVSGQGPSVFGQVQARTGAGMIAQALSGLAGQIQYLGVVENRIAAAAELSKLQREATTTKDNLLLGFQKEEDYRTYMPDFEETFAALAEADVKNPFAKRSYENWLNEVRPAWTRQVQAATRARHIDDYETNYFEERAKAIDTGNFGQLIQLNKGGVLNGIFKEKWAQEDLREAQHESQKRLAMRMAMDDPAAMRERIKGSKIDGFPLLTEGDTVDVRHIMQAQERYNEVEESDAQRDFYKKLNKKAVGRDVRGAIEMVMSNDDLDPKEVPGLIRNIASIAGLMQAGKGNPYTTTQNWPEYVKAEFNLRRDPTSMTDAQILQGTGRWWTDAQKEKLFRLKYADEEDDVMREPYAQERLLSVDVQYMDPETRMIRPDSYADWARTIDAVEALIKKYVGGGRRDYDGCEKAIGRVMEPVRRKRARFTLKDFLIATRSPNLWAAMRLKGGLAGKPAPKQGQGRPLRLDVAPVPVDSLEEAAKLPSGTRVIYKGEVKTVR